MAYLGRDQFVQRLCGETETLEDSIKKLLEAPSQVAASLRGQPFIRTEVARREESQETAGDTAVTFPVNSALIAERFRERRALAAHPSSTTDRSLQKADALQSTVLAPETAERTNTPDTSPNNTEAPLCVEARVSDAAKAQMGALPSQSSSPEPATGANTDWMLSVSLLAAAVSSAIGTILKSTKPERTLAASPVHLPSPRQRSPSPAKIETKQHSPVAASEPEPSIPQGVEASIWPSRNRDRKPIAESREATEQQRAEAFTEAPTRQEPEETSRVILPASIQASLERARTFLDPTTPRTVAERKFFEEQDRSYDEAVEMVQTHLGLYDYASIRRRLATATLDDGLSPYVRDGVKSESRQLSDWRRRIQEEIAQRIADSTHKPRRAATKQTEKRPFAESNVANEVRLQKRALSKLGCHQVEQPSKREPRETAENEITNEEKGMASRRLHRKRDHPETSPVRRLHGRGVVNRDGSGASRKKPKPQIAFGRRVPVSNEDISSTNDNVVNEKGKRKRERNEGNRISVSDKGHPVQHGTNVDATLVDGLVEALLSTTRARAPAPSEAPLERAPQTKQLDTCMHVPIRWGGRPRGENGHTLSTAGAGSDDSVRELLKHLPPRLERGPVVDHWTKSRALSPSRTGVTSDDLLRQFVSQLAEKEANVALDSALPTQPKPRPQTATPAGPAPLDATERNPLPPHIQAHRDEERNLNEAPSRESRVDTACQTISDAPGQHQPNAAPLCMDDTPGNCPPRLWRPTSDFHESESSLTPLPSSTAPSSDAFSSSEPTSEELKSMKRVRETSQWRHFRKQHYKAQKQRLLQRHGIYDPLLFTSGSESITSESTFQQE